MWASNSLSRPRAPGRVATPAPPTTIVSMNGLSSSCVLATTAVLTAGGDWWSSTAGSAPYGRYLDTWTGVVYAQIINFRGHGFALRCGATCNGVTSSTYE